MDTWSSELVAIEVITHQMKEPRARIIRDETNSRNSIYAHGHDVVPEGLTKLVALLPATSLTTSNLCSKGRLIGDEKKKGRMDHIHRAGVSVLKNVSVSMERHFTNVALTGQPRTAVWLGKLTSTTLFGGKFIDTSAWQAL